MAAATDHAVFIAHAQIWPLLLITCIIVHAQLGLLLLIMWLLLRICKYGCCSSVATDHVAFIAPVKKMAAATDHMAFIGLKKMTAATDHVAFIAPVKKVAAATDHVAFIVHAQIWLLLLIRWPPA